MKKLLLLFFTAVTAAVTAQVTFTIEEPASIYGDANFTYGTTAQSWGSPDMTDPANALMDTVILVDDGTGATNPQACQPVINDCSGKIAMLYRGNCTFGSKALAAYNAGAVGVIIVNDAGNAVGMNGGTEGATVPVPVFMVSQADGALIRGALDNGEDVIVNIYNKTNFYERDLKIGTSTTLFPQEASTLIENALDDTEYSFDLGAWIYNLGSEDQDSIQLIAEVTHAGATVFKDTSDMGEALSQDSVFLDVPKFSLPTYNVGEYTLEYTVIIPQGDEYTPDNIITRNFRFDDLLYSKAEIDDNGNLVNVARSEQRISEMCIVYQDSNASRKSAVGLGFSSFLPPSTLLSLEDQYFQIFAYEWNDQFEDLSDPVVNNIDFANLDLATVAFGEYIYSGDDRGVTVWADFEEPFRMQDNQRYAFCVRKDLDSVLMGVDSKVDYHLNSDNYLEPDMLLWNNDDQTWFIDYGNVNQYAGVILKTGPGDLSVEENSVAITPFPNPASDYVLIPFNMIEGKADLKITDMMGRHIRSQQLLANKGSQTRVDLSSLSDGVYIFNLSFDNGKMSTFKVTVAK